MPENKKGLLAELDHYLEVMLTADSKFWVVALVLSIVLVSLFVYLIFTDKKISKVENELETLMANKKSNS